MTHTARDEWIERLPLEQESICFDTAKAFESSRSSFLYAQPAAELNLKIRVHYVDKDALETSEKSAL